MSDTTLNPSSVQIARRSFNEAIEAIRVDVVQTVGGSGSGGTVDQGAPALIGNSWPVKITDTIDTLAINADGSLNVANVVSVVASSAALTSASVSASSFSVLSSNASRKGFLIYNDSSTNVYIGFAASTSTTAFTAKLNPGMTYQNEAIIYTGIISAIGDAATGSLRITELS